MGNNRYDWGIYNGISGIPWDRTEKKQNTRNHVVDMLNRSLLMFHYEGLPDSIPAMELERLLQSNGYVGITEVNDELYALYGGLGGQGDAYNRPTQMVVSNPWLNYNATLTIGEDVVLMRNDSMMVGLIPMYSKYTTIMNENEITMVLSSISKRVNNLISVSDDATAESAKAYLSKLEEGDLGYVFESKLFDSLKTNPMGSHAGSGMTDLIELQQYMKASMYNEIGLNANYNMKRERLSTSEVEMNSENLYPLVDNMLENRRIAIEQINEKYGLEITVEFNSSWNYRVNQGESVHQGDLEETLGDEDDIHDGIPRHSRDADEDVLEEEDEDEQGATDVDLEVEAREVEEEVSEDKGSDNDTDNLAEVEEQDVDEAQEIATVADEVIDKESEESDTDDNTDADTSDDDNSIDTSSDEPIDEEAEKEALDEDEEEK